MILVVGGSGNGKLDYVRSLGYGDDQIDDAMIGDRPVVNDLQDLVAKDPAAAPDLFDTLIQKEVVICDEVGSGVIPATREGRDAREQTGRLCTRLAKEATEVIRLVVGIPMRVK